MSVVRSLPLDRFVFDASPLLLPAVSGFFAMVLVGSCAMTVHLVKKNQVAIGSYREAFRNAVIFCSTAAILCGLVLGRLAVGVVNFYTGHHRKAYRIIDGVTNGTLAIAILVYVALQVVPLVRTRLTISKASAQEGYVPLEDNTSND